MSDGTPNRKYVNLVISSVSKDVLRDILIHAGEYYPHLSASEREEYVHAALEKVFLGEQSWNPEARPDIRSHLAWVLRSVIGNDQKRAGNARRAPSIMTGEGLSVNPVELVPDCTRLADEMLSVDERIECVRQAAEGDEQAELVLMALEEGITSPLQIAEETGIDRKMVYTTLRRMRRRAAKLNAGKKRS
ncbi:hypothetical protein KKH27_01215 [bacterium]|nr:hypothetical protein [bacterium]